MARVVRPGGRVLMNVFGDPREIEFFGLLQARHQGRGPRVRGPAERSPLASLPGPQDPERLRGELAGPPGCNDIGVDTIIETLRSSGR